MGTCDAIETPDVGMREANRNLPEALKTGSNAVQVLFERQVSTQPEATALLFEDRRMTYAELNRRANQIAHAIRRRGAGPGAIVALRVERSFEMIAGIFGILKSGAAYLPIDPAYPAERQKFILADSGARWMLTQKKLSPVEHGGEILFLDAGSEQLEAESELNAEIQVQPDDLAYVIYTSGSTGQPKGVLVTHGNLSHSTRARFEYYTAPVRNFLLLSSFAFDSSVAGIFWTLCQGGALTLPHEYSQQTAAELADLISRHSISHLLCLPSLYAVLLDQPAALRSLEAVIVAGEACAPALVKRHHQLLPHTALYNEYGPTEATVWSTVHRCRVEDGDRPVPIGTPIPGTQLLIVDDHLRPVASGEPGELCIGGPGVALGYLKRPELTAAKFLLVDASGAAGNYQARIYRTGDRVRLLPDGTLEFLGRRDQQIKLRGHRIELEEIESALKRHPAVLEAIVSARSIGSVKPANGEAEAMLIAKLSALPEREAMALINSVAGEPGAVASITAHRRDNDGFEHFERRDAEFAVNLEMRPGFIRPPRDSQRSWLLNRALDEFQEDVRQLDAQAKQFVPGVEPDWTALTADRTQAELGEQQILEDWHIPLMKAMAGAVTETHGDILEIGFGRGVASGFLQERGIRSHTIIECNDSVIRRFFEPWRAGHADRDIRLVRGKWQDVIEGLGAFDGIFFQTYPLDEREFHEYLSRSVSFAEHFFPIASRHLKPGGAFTYLTHEIDSMSRRHQRLLFEHFSSIRLGVERLQLPPDCADLWWANSMVVVKAVK